MKIQIKDIPWQVKTGHWYERGRCPSRWITCKASEEAEQIFMAFRRNFELAEEKTVRVHVTADERYKLYVDGKLCGKGPERGMPDSWFFDTYEFKLKAGKHIFCAIVWSEDKRLHPWAQMSLHPGFFLHSEDMAETLSTGTAPWEAKTIKGVQVTDINSNVLATGGRFRIDASKYPWNIEKGQGTGWKTAEIIHHGISASDVMEHMNDHHLLRQGTLPAMLRKKIKAGKAVYLTEFSDGSKNEPVDMNGRNKADEAELWNKMLSGTGKVSIAPDRKIKVLLKLDDYTCAYPSITLSGGKNSSIKVNWAEALYTHENGVVSKVKGKRSEFDGKIFRGAGDEFLPDGKKHSFEPFWWIAGLYIEVAIETGAEALEIEDFSLYETHYPFEFKSSFRSSLPEHQEIEKLALRTLEMCSHETYMDCPYYEQLMYVGDTRLEILATYMTTDDTALPFKAISLFDRSRRLSGLTTSRYPTDRIQIIPTFSLIWVCMTHDFAVWRRNEDDWKTVMKGVRSVLDTFRDYINKDGLVEGPIGWNFMDWVKSWNGGIPPDGDYGVSCMINWLFVLALKAGAELEEFSGETELASRNRKLASSLAVRIKEKFFDTGSGLFADDLKHEFYSEHSQSLAVISAELSETESKALVEKMLKAEGLAQASIYFSHYLFEAYRITGNIDAMLKRMNFWKELIEIGCKTCIEEPEPSRSDCHAWGAHPVYHYRASILGIRPDSAGFKSVRIRPQLGMLEFAEGSLVHPEGLIKALFRKVHNGLEGEIELPGKLCGTLEVNGKTIVLQPGLNVLKA